MRFLRRILGSLNVVSVPLILILVGGAYAGWKFIPPYWQAQNVDAALQNVTWEASKIELYSTDPRGQELLARARREILDLGVDERTLHVYFAGDLRAVHADYVVVVTHPWIEPTVLKFSRKREIPQAQFE